MPARIAPVVLCALVVLGFHRCPVEVVQVNRSLPGFQEPNTPGAPGVAAGPALVELLGDDPDLNRVSLVKTFALPPRRPKAIVILIPGFLGGASTFDPLARDLVEASRGRVQVWAIDRRPNQLEDQLGARVAQAGIEAGNPDALFQGAQFYFSDVNVVPLEEFPDENDLDLNLDGDFDPQLPLEDEFGNVRLPVIFEQDDVRSFMAHWGIDTYMRDWKRVVRLARWVVGRRGTVLLGGHSQGTTWVSIFAAYDFDPGAGVDAGHELVDGLILLEGGGVRPAPCSSTPPPATPADYLAEIAALEAPGGPDVFLQKLTLGGTPVLELTDLGTIGQVAALAGVFDPDAPALIQRTPIFSGGLLGLLLFAPASNQAIAGLFLDDDFSLNPAFRATMGFTDNGPNLFGVFGQPIYVAQPVAGDPSALRTWKHFDDPTLPVCEPGGVRAPGDGTGCAVNTDPALGGDPRDREVTHIDAFLRSQFEVNNGFEWYFADGHVSLDFRFCNDSSALGDESLLAITRNAEVAIPVLGVGGSNGLASTESAFDTYLGSIATAAADTFVCILDGYAHVDPLTASENETAPLILDMIDAVRSGRSLGAALTCPGTGP